MLLESEQWNTSVHPSRRQIPIALLMAVLAQLQGGTTHRMHLLSLHNVATWPGREWESLEERIAAE